MAALTGIRVVDFGRVLAGPHCAQTLLDLGAEVIKIEPPSGDIARRASPRRGEISGYYAQQNAGKRNISIDLNVEGHARSHCGYATRPTSSWRISAPAPWPPSGWDTRTSRRAILVLSTPPSAATASTDRGVHVLPTPRLCPSHWLLS